MGAESLPELFTVEVTAEDIVNGERGYCTLCPVALALQRTHPVKDGWLVGHYAATLVAMKRVGRRSEYDHDAVNFITRFDDGESVEPFTVTLVRHHA